MFIPLTFTIGTPIGNHCSTLIGSLYWHMVFFIERVLDHHLPLWHIYIGTTDSWSMWDVSCVESTLREKNLSFLNFPYNNVQYFISHYFYYIFAKHWRQVEGLFLVFDYHIWLNENLRTGHTGQFTLKFPNSSHYVHTHGVSYHCEKLIQAMRGILSFTLFKKNFRLVFFCLIELNF